MISAPSVISALISGEQVLSLPILDAQGCVIGELRPLSRASLEDDALMVSITKWRNSASKSFLTQFQATPERTRLWLQNVVLCDNARLLFLIHSTTKLIGHYGFKGLTAESAEVDNLVRGESGGHPQLVHFAEIALIRWMFETFDIESLFGYVLADNWQAIELHARVGFQNAERVPLLKRIVNGETFFDMGEPGMTSPDNLYSQKISLVRADFRAKGHGA